MNKRIIAISVIAGLALMIVPSLSQTCFGAVNSKPAASKTTNKAVCPMMSGGKVKAGATCPTMGDMSSKVKAGGTCPAMGSMKGKTPMGGAMKGACPMMSAKAPAKKVVSAVCPVMGNKIPNVAKAAGKSVYKGKTYYFCCPGCKPAFDKNPEKYINKKKK